MILMKIMLTTTAEQYKINQKNNAGVSERRDTTHKKRHSPHKKRTKHTKKEFST
jgi:hypothetical protein